jgi:hypothetical protein
MDAKRHIDEMRDLAPRAALGVAGITRNGWTSIGPGNIGGRVRAIAIHPTSTDTMFIGSVGGGIWKTTDGGATWSVVDDFMANIAVSSIVMTPGNPSVMYAGTGEGFYNSDGLRGAGIFKSTDGGTSWTQLAATSTLPGAGMTAFDFYYITELAISPDGGTLLASTTTGIYRSINGGSTFTRATMAGGGAIDVGTYGMVDVDFHPTDSTRAVAANFAGAAIYSTDGGATWNAATGLPGGTFVRSELAYAPTNGNTVYAGVDVNNGNMYKSSDGGQTYAGVCTGVCTSTYNGGAGSQGWYDNLVFVSPTNENFVVWGGIDLWRSINGGVGWSKMSDWQSQSLTGATSAHADHHIAVADPNFNGTSNQTVFFGNDGGVYKTTDVSTVGGGASPYTSGWTELNNGLAITQFYGGAGNTASGKITGGTQDNGTLLYTPGVNASENWTLPFDGDGGFSAYDSADANYFYGEYVFAQVHRNTSGGAGFSSYIFSGITDAGNTNAEFIAAFVKDPGNNNRLLVGSVRLWRTNDVKAVSPTWESIKATLGMNDKISAIGIAPQSSDVVYAGHNSGRLYKTTSGTAIAATVLGSWATIDDNGGANPLPNRRITRITVDPSNVNTVYVTFGGFSGDNIYRSIDGGANWTDITGPNGGPTALPNVPVRDLEINPANSNFLYAGTEVGIFASSDGGATWSLPHDGPSNVSVDELFFMGTTLVAVTHGRGMFIQTAYGQPPGAFAKTSPANNATGQGSTPTLTWGTSATASSYEYCIDTTNNNTCEAGYVNVGAMLTATPSTLVTNTTYYWQVRARNDIGTTEADSGMWRTLTTADFARNDARRASDADGDRKADIIVYRPSGGDWWILKSEANYTTYQFTHWGAAADTPVPGDYDGDGKLDLAVFRGSNGTWFILQSSTNYSTWSVINWGVSTDRPVQGDYDGDGRTDIAVYRPSTGQWWVLQSTGNFATYQVTNWGAAADTPVPADYDGDGKTDPAFYHPASGVWSVLYSSTNYATNTSVAWGLSTDKAVPGDYDGDGKADIAVYRPSTGVWFRLFAANNFTTYASTNWGASEDTPVVADYDGDGKADLTVYRPSIGTWYTLFSGGGYTSTSWGISTDVPLPRYPQ